MIFLSLIAVALGGPLIERPSAGPAIVGQCKQVYPVKKGQPLPPEVLGLSGKVDCYAVLVPLSDYSDLLTTEVWATSIAQQYQIDIATLQADNAWYKAKLEAETQPLPWMERPTTQRWFGRTETMIVVGITTVGLGQDLPSNKCRL